MHSALPLAYAARHIYSQNADPYRAPSGRTGSAKRRRRRRSAAFLLPGRPRLGLFHRRTAAGR
jgi:hypothetical protein